MGMTIITTAFAVCLSSVISCNNKEFSERTDYSLAGDTILVQAQSVIAPKIRPYRVEEEDFRQELTCAGTVKAIPNYYAEIAPPFAGRVTRVMLKLGMKTRAGTPLFEMTSPDFIAAQKVYFQAKSEWETAKLSLNRQKDLKANGVGSAKDLEEAELNYTVKEKEYQNAIISLKIFGVQDGKLVFGQPLVIFSPISGEVVDNEVVLGHYIKDDDPPRAKIADLSKVWVVGMVKEKDIRFVHKLDSATVTIAAFPQRRIAGKVYHVNEIVDTETRSVQVLIECRNDDRTLKPGMYATVQFTDAPTRTILIPAKAVLQFNDKSFVFVQIAPGAYVRRVVETGVSDATGGRITITSGLRAGETIIGEGAFYLLEAK